MQEFVGLLAAFSPKAGRAEKLQFLFTVHDIDGDGMLSSEDLQLMLRQLAGTSLRSVRVMLQAPGPWLYGTSPYNCAPVPAQRS